MEHASPLPPYLIENYSNWKTTTFAENEARFRQLVSEGQKPPAMVISCCDSRVHAASIFGAEPGDFFMHRNIANFVPPYDPEGGNAGTAAAIEYGVTALKVSHLIVMGHSSCGGIAGCHAKCSGNAPQLEEETSFVGHWVELMRPGYDRVVGRGTPVEDQVGALELESVLVSLENLMGFPFVKAAVERGELTLHGLWTDLVSGDVLQYSADTGKFEAL